MTHENDEPISLEETLRRAFDEAAANGYGWSFGSDAIARLVHTRHVPREEVCATLNALEEEALSDDKGERARYVARLANAWSPPPGKEHVMQSPLSDRDLMLEAIATASDEEPLYQVVYWLVHGRKSDRERVWQQLSDFIVQCDDADPRIDWLQDAQADLTGFCGPARKV